MSEYSSLSVGYMFDDPLHPYVPISAPNLYRSYHEIRELSVDFGITTLTQPGYGINQEGDLISVDSDFVLLNLTWSNHTMIRIPSDIVRQLESTDTEERNSAHKRFLQLVDWAQHLSLPAIYVPSPTCAHPVQLAKTLRESLDLCAEAPSFWLEIPLLGREENESNSSNDGIIDPWDTWDWIRCACDSNSLLRIALKFPSSNDPDVLPIPSSIEIGRWLSEYVAAIVLPTDLFRTNPSHYPCLAVKMQKILRQVMKAGSIQVVICGPPRHFPPTLEDGEDGPVERVVWGDEEESETSSDSSEEGDEDAPSKKRKNKKKDTFRNTIGLIAPRPGEEGEDPIGVAKSEEWLNYKNQQKRKRNKRRAMKGKGNKGKKAANAADGEENPKEQGESDDDEDDISPREKYLRYYRAHTQLYSKYIQYLGRVISPTLFSAVESYLASFRDYLQSPLQPLKDQLHSQTYETFEKDPVKYRLYQEGITAALASLPALLFGGVDAERGVWRRVYRHPSHYSSYSYHFKHSQKQHGQQVGCGWKVICEKRRAWIEKQKANNYAADHKEWLKELEKELRKKREEQNGNKKEKDEKDEDNEEDDEDEDEDELTVSPLVMLLGAGRGPLLRCIFRAIAKVNEIREWMVEELEKEEKKKMMTSNEKDEEKEKSDRMNRLSEMMKDVIKEEKKKTNEFGDSDEEEEDEEDKLDEAALAEAEEEIFDKDDTTEEAKKRNWMKSFRKVFPQITVPTVAQLETALTPLITPSSEENKEAERESTSSAPKVDLNDLIAMLSLPVSPRVVALEKNQNALITLKALTGKEWPADVELLSADMREKEESKEGKCGKKKEEKTTKDSINEDMFGIKSSSSSASSSSSSLVTSSCSSYFGKASLIVSELLGSFGDNELSPECLDGGQRFLRCQRGGGVSIPADSSSWLCPVCAPFVHSEIEEMAFSWPLLKEKEKERKELKEKEQRTGDKCEGSESEESEEMKKSPYYLTVKDGIVSIPLKKIEEEEEEGKEEDCSYKTLRVSPFETPFVVKLHRHIRTAAIKRVFTFVHPNPILPPSFKQCCGKDVSEGGELGGEHSNEKAFLPYYSMPSSNEHNERVIKVTFTAGLTARWHGFVGYFTSTLFKYDSPSPFNSLPFDSSKTEALPSSSSSSNAVESGGSSDKSSDCEKDSSKCANDQLLSDPTPSPMCIQLSTHPFSHSPDMYSWFPIFFPLTVPVRVERGEQVEVSMRRRYSEQRNEVWYEWRISSPPHLVTHWHNENGRSYSIGC
ncbi:putative Skb1 methyltransferase family protein [Monocercomonoides exilis]|uniref:putative Skb1 methyltransferase family protein n=1 Tax=Monocercomonoides exilis TaxID=2049356 RepID=UPI0035599065|nr:putative Skb1 methyltransferase family protein [Monocercomonoides exilis]|eukprot:MONOS_14936.1-p1 / transcript=MONOS_14936.1 / gene=MONOS_14936 / organism=Monocercomonoides_exilis_PA203 / gene_product=Skb1 methyltransferase family protein / transcript_product=Skb1 methyltransferase family protein / location=Mono_scaffold01109:1685-5473(-) / protein_length=1262 / sequence_SO=supercontig / SO=protein_coding / is_pseudo=false